MSKRNKSFESAVSYPSRGYGLVLQENVPDWLVGRVLTIIDALGLKDAQEKSCKDLLKNEIYQLNSENQGTLWIPPSLNDELYRIIHDILDTHDHSVPMSWSNYKFKITYEKE